MTLRSHFILSLLLFCSSSHGAILFGPSLYFSEKDSPFYGGIVDNAGNGIYLENFEDQALNTPFVQQPEGVFYVGATIRSVFPNISDGVVRSVDGDDGAVDGQTFAGDSWRTTDFSGGGVSNRIGFDFLPDDQGRYPRYVGIVVTRVFNVDTDVEIGWLNPDGELLFRDGEFDPKDWRPEGGAPNGSPLTMRFIGLFSEEGIAKLQIRNASQVDHLQYGYSIPEPSTSTFGMVMILVVVMKRRRKIS